MQIILLFSILLFKSFAGELYDSAILKAELSKLTQSTHKPITYAQANLILFTKLDNHNGLVCSVYSPTNCLTTDIVPSPKLMNIEHTWPQSEGARGDAKSDLHHLFPVESSVNSMRSSLPFCDVEIIKWEKNQSKRGLSKFNEHCFEPPIAHKGNVARALFYFSIRYQQPINKNQAYFLRKWHKEDPVDQQEIDHNIAIKSFQNNSNPFIEHPELVERLLEL
jgi:hypothetical protein